MGSSCGEAASTVRLIFSWPGLHSRLSSALQHRLPGASGPDLATNGAILVTCTLQRRFLPHPRRLSRHTLHRFHLLRNSSPHRGKLLSSGVPLVNYRLPGCQLFTGGYCCTTDHLGHCVSSHESPVIRGGPGLKSGSYSGSMIPLAMPLWMIIPLCAGLAISLGKGGHHGLTMKMCITGGPVRAIRADPICQVGPFESKGTHLLPHFNACAVSSHVDEIATGIALEG